MDLGTAAASAWSAGISLYGVIAAVGIAGRLRWIEANPFFERPEVIGIALVLFVVEFVVDKIAFLDSLWDLIHTFLRPLGGAMIGALAPHQQLPMPVAIALGATLSLSAHAAKSTTRMVVNASPEPASNVVVSALEDGFVAAFMALAFAYPKVAGVIALILGVVSVVFSIVMFRTARRAWRSVRARWRRWRGRQERPPPDPAGGAWPTVPS